MKERKPVRKLSSEISKSDTPAPSSLSLGPLGALSPKQTTRPEEQTCWIPKPIYAENFVAISKAEWFKENLKTVVL